MAHPKLRRIFGDPAPIVRLVEHIAGDAALLTMGHGHVTTIATPREFLVALRQ